MLLIFLRNQQKNGKSDGMGVGSQINPICSSKSDIIYGKSLALFFTETIFLKIHLLLKREKLLG